MSTGDRMNTEEAKRQSRDGNVVANGGQQPGVGKQTRSGAMPGGGGDGQQTAGAQGQRAGSWETTPELISAMGMGGPEGNRDAKPAATAEGATAEGAAAEGATTNDPFKVDQGQLTFDAEGTEGGRYHTRTAHWPGGASGVTIGRGYDLGHHTKDNIVEDMTAAGIAPADADKFAAATGLKGQPAKDWLDTNGSTLAEITSEQQEALFETTYAEHLTDVKRISGNYAKTKGKEAGTDGAELQIDFDTLHPAIKDILVDLRYRGDYTPATRVHVQPLAIANDLQGLATVMADKEKWASVPADRFERRKKYMADAVLAEQAGGGTDNADAGAKTTATAKPTTTTPTGGTTGGNANANANGAATAKPATGTATLKANVNVRKTAASSGQILETAKKGSTFKVLANVGSWYQVEHGGGTAYITTLAEYVGFEATPVAKAEAPKGATDPQATQTPQGGGEAQSESWLDKAWSAASHLVDVTMSFFSGTVEEQKEAEGEQIKTDQGDKQPLETKTGTGTTTGEATVQGPDKPAVPGGSLLFKDAFEVVDADARLRDVKLKPNGKTVAKGTKVFVVKADKTYVQIVTSPDAETKIVEADQLWTAFSNLGGSGADVGLGNEKSDQADKTKADELRAGLPSGRNAGKSAFKWQFSGYFQPSLEGRALESTLMAKVQALMQWAVENDMVTGDIIIGDGVRGPKTAHKMCVAWNIQFRYGTIITLAALKALPGGKDADGTKWYEEGWTEEQIKENAKNVRASTKIAAAGYDYGDAARAPLPLNSRPGVSRHCTGRAVDVTIPWRSAGKDAATNATDVWAWEDVYKQFGLHRPLHKTLVSDAKLQENWHIEETGKKLDDDDTDD